jgi:hypothetical protein
MKEQQLRQLIREELLQEVMYGVDRFYVIAVKNKDGQNTVVKDIENGMSVHKVTKAKRFETEREAQQALERYMEKPWAPDPRSKAEAYVAKVRAELERV